MIYMLAFILWLYMPVSKHKSLIHSSQVIQKLELQIGMYSEEALESRNKDHKKIRENHTRKCNRQLTMTDLFCRLYLIKSFTNRILYKYLKVKKKKYKLI
jgi:hypothetical protein